MSVDSSPSNKKHRVIGWKPEGADQPAAPTRGLPRWARTALWVVGIFLIWRLGVAPLVFRQGTDAGVAGPGATAAGGSVGQEFADRSRAEFARNAAQRAIEVVEKAPTDHSAITQRRIVINNLRDVADKALADRDFLAAVQRYEAVTKEAQSLANALDDRRKAREGYDKFLVRAAHLEQFKYLDPESFTLAETAAGASGSFLDKGSFTLAREKIDEATAALDALDRVLVAELEAHLAIGRAALTAGDGRAAQIAFNRALEFQPKNEVAAKGYERAKKIDEVFALNKSAAALEAAGKLEDAQKSYEKAFALDGLSATAQAGISRTKGAIIKRDFGTALAKAREARDLSRWDDAIASYEAALKVVPTDKDVEKELAEAKVQQRETKIQNMLAAAYDFERDYSWDLAKRTYLDLIAYEPGQTDAEEGLLRTGKVIRALLVFEKKIEEARSQVQRANFQLAISAFNEAMASKPSYLELTPEQVQLKNILERQSKPVQVTFISDEKTYVTISGVRMLNKFGTVTVPLLPGNYEIIGRRKGYEEVRERLQIRADDSVPPVTIVANKKI